MRKLEELLNLDPAPRLGEINEDDTLTADSDQSKIDINEARETLTAVDEAIDKIDIALPTVRDLDASDQEMDELATLAKNTFSDLVDLGMNVEARFSGPILQTAAVLLGHAVTAKVAKMDKKLKMVDLQLKKARLDQQANQNPIAKAIEGNGVVVDRNELLRSILAQSSDRNK